MEIEETFVAASALEPWAQRMLRASSRQADTGPMLYLLAIILPPVALLVVGKPYQAFVALFLVFSLVGWPPASLWAVLVTANHKAEKAHKAKR